ncbi:MAG TPA: hypothetical protein VGY48_09940 [Vicinamibacterales bacterium]|nr:hypothetical protein [Vicinamibacterales bacterium]
MRDSTESEGRGIKVSRRWLLRNTASLTAGAVALSSMSLAATEATSPAEPAVAPDHDPATGEIFDRDRHHHWDTV